MEFLPTYKGAYVVSGDGANVVSGDDLEAIEKDYKEAVKLEWSEEREAYKKFQQQQQAWASLACPPAPSCPL